MTTPSDIARECARDWFLQCGNHLAAWDTGAPVTPQEDHWDAFAVFFPNATKEQRLEFECSFYDELRRLISSGSRML